MRKNKPWKLMSDGQILQYAREHNYNKFSPTELYKADRWFYAVLRNRNLSDKILKTKKRSWRSHSDEEILNYGLEHGYQGLTGPELAKKDPGYKDILFKKKLQEKLVRITRRRVSWNDMTDDEIINFGIEHGYDGLTSGKLKKRDPTYLFHMYKRGLSVKILKTTHRKWDSSTDEEILRYGIEQGYRGITFMELRKKDPSYAQILSKRKLISKILKRTIRNWGKMTDQEILEYARKSGYMGVQTGRLSKIDPAFYDVLNRRGLIDDVATRKFRNFRNWSKMTDENIVNYGIEHNYTRLSFRELSKLDSSYRQILEKRNLLHKVISLSPRRNFRKMSDQEIIQFAKKSGFGGLPPSEIERVDASF